jgi:hypothetical protein
MRDESLTCARGWPTRERQLSRSCRNWGSTPTGCDHEPRVPPASSQLLSYFQGSRPSAGYCGSKLLRGSAPAAAALPWHRLGLDGGRRSRCHAPARCRPWLRPPGAEAGGDVQRTSPSGRDETALPKTRRLPITFGVMPRNGGSGLRMTDASGANALRSFGDASGVAPMLRGSCEDRQAIPSCRNRRLRHAEPLPDAFLISGEEPVQGLFAARRNADRAGHER